MEDELNHGLRKVRDKWAIHVWIVFAVRIFLDLQDILGEDIKRGLQDQKTIYHNTTKALLSTGALQLRAERASTRAAESIVREKITWLPSESDPASRLIEASNCIKCLPPLKKMIIDRYYKRQNYSERVQKRDDEALTEDTAKGTEGLGFELPDFVQQSQNDDSPMNNAIRDRYIVQGLGVSAEKLERARKLGAWEATKPNRDLDFVFSRNPAYCGTVAFGMEIMKEHAGSLLHNYHIGSTLMAHPCIFNGLPPRSAKEAYTRYADIIGLTNPTAYPYGTFYQRGTPYKEIQYQSHALASTLYPFFENRKASLYTVLGGVETLLQMEREKVYHASIHKHRDARRKLTPLQFLEHLQEYLPKQMSDLRLNYITLTVECHALMKKIRAELKAQLGIWYDDNPLEAPGCPIKVVYCLIVLYILEEAKEVHGT
ncbi:hypothetical protein HYFRA_00005375 [Hymenoscyphus fraxineus]|uniref:Uncharacterized protein n=1 Tax=Hymenoscyphus fraxineus TaxID=746836 RepID=A0A9N9L8D8_9HELO|nr:hypothetical protein HYFRA_00005375 [Hymenoscyphus fraxineus]